MEYHRTYELHYSPMDSNYPEEKAPAYQPVPQHDVAYSDQTPNDNLLHTDVDHTVCQRRSRKRRACRVILTLITIWVAYTFLPIFFGRHMSRSGCHSRNSPELAAALLEPPIPPDVDIEDCANMTQDSVTTTNLLRGRFSSSAEFKLPLSSETLFLLSRGTAAGSVNFVQSDKGGEDVKVHVVATYRHESALEYIKVCQLNRGEDERGVGVFAPRWSGRRIGVNFDITVHLPSGSGKSPLKIKNFETDLPLFVHNVGNLADTVHFDALSFKTTLTAINVGSLSATEARLATSNAKIEGTFNTSTSLDLSTANAPINVTVGLSNGKNAEATRLSMSTTNAAIGAKLSLVSGSKTGGEFIISGTTAVGPVDMIVNDAPVGSSISLKARTALAPATVKMHPAYEGEFILSTSLRGVSLSVDEKVEDPAGKERKRAVDIRRVGSSRVTGSVSWSPEGKHLGFINVETSMAPAVLEL